MGNGYNLIGNNQAFSHDIGRTIMEVACSSFLTRDRGLTPPRGLADRRMLSFEYVRSLLENKKTKKSLF